VEFSALTGKGQRNDLVIDSIRDRGLDDFAENAFAGPDYIIDVWGKGWATSQDSFGNFEATPPITVDGVYYPFGRIYWGESGNLKPHKKLTKFFKDQLVQKPIGVDISWLCVGHVDEFATFIPDPASDKGFRLVYSDIDMGYDLLEQQNRNLSLPRYESGHHFATVGDILDDNAVRATNEDLRDDYLHPILDQYISEFGLVEEDIIRIPALFEVAPQCGQYTAALIPGAANLVVDNYGGQTTLLVADPFMRTDLEDQSSDPVIADFNARMPSTAKVVFVDDWSVYHMGLGEVHCGSNTIRTPSVNWWEEATHLLEAN
jgi:protein-arginine deiminase